MSGAEVPILIISVSSVIGSITYLTSKIKRASCGCMSCEQAVETGERQMPPPPLEQHLPPAFQEAQARSKKVSIRRRITRALTPRRRPRQPQGAEASEPPQRPAPTPGVDDIARTPAPPVMMERYLTDMVPDEGAPPLDPPQSAGVDEVDDDVPVPEK